MAKQDSSSPEKSISNHVERGTKSTEASWHGRRTVEKSHEGNL